MSHIMWHSVAFPALLNFSTLSPMTRISGKSYFEILYDFGPKYFRRVHKMSVHLSAWNNSAATGRIFITFDI